MSVMADVILDKSNRSKTIQRQVLIVDDDLAVATLLQEGLAKLPHCQIHVATEGEQVLHLLQNDEWDLLITDFQMPKMDGMMLAEQVRLTQPALPIMIITGYSELISPQAIKTLSLNYILDKPVKLTKIRSVVSDLLR